MTLRYEDIKTKTNRILDLTSLTVDEFEQLVVPFEAAFVRPRYLVWNDAVQCQQVDTPTARCPSADVAGYRRRPRPSPCRFAAAFS